MKYTIEGFNQEYAVSLRKEIEVKGKTVVRKIDCTDLVILRWFVDFYPSMKKMTVDGEEYAWLTHKKLVADLPLVDISKRSFSERMQKLVDFGLLSYRLVLEGGTFSLYGFGKNYCNLVSSRNEGGAQNLRGGAVQTAGGCGSNSRGGAVQTAHKDISIIDSSIKDSSTNNNTIVHMDSNVYTYGQKCLYPPDKSVYTHTTGEADLSSSEIPFTENPYTGNSTTANSRKKSAAADIEEFFERVWKLYPKKTNKTQIRKATKERLYKIGYEKIARCIERYKQELEYNHTEYQFIKSGSTFFNGGYEDYLADDWRLPPKRAMGQRHDYMPNRTPEEQAALEAKLAKYKFD